YPRTGRLEEVGEGLGRGYTVNLPLPAGTGDDDFVALYQALLVPIAADFRPDLVVVSAGFDAHRDDPLGGMRMTAAGFEALAAIVRGIADRHADGRLLLVLEGGYDLDALVDGARPCRDTMRAEHADAPPPGAPGDRARRLLEAALVLHAACGPSPRAVETAPPPG